MKTHAIGDALMVTPAMKALRENFPEAHLALLTGLKSGRIMEGNPSMDELITFDESVLFKPRLGQLFRLILSIRKKKFDTAFIFQYSPLIHLLIATLDISIRIGFAKQDRSFFLTHGVPWDESGDRWTGDVYLDLVRFVGARISEKSMVIVVSGRDLKFADNLLKDGGLREGKRVIGVFPGGGKNFRDIVYQRRWGIERYAALVCRITEMYDPEILVLGAPDERELGARLQAITGVRMIDACGKTDLKQLAALIQRCSLLITNDSAPLHIAIAVGTPTVSVFGPTRARAQVEANDKHIAIQSTDLCSPCYWNRVFPGCEKPSCMEKISVESVVAAIEKQWRRIYREPGGGKA